MCLAYSSGVLKNYNKFIFVRIKKNKRFYGKSKVNFKFLLSHTIKIISVFYDKVLIRSFVLFLTLSLIFSSFKIVFFIFFIFMNSIFLFTYYYLKPKN